MLDKRSITFAMTEIDNLFYSGAAHIYDIKSCHHRKPISEGEKVFSWLSVFDKQCSTIILLNTLYLSVQGLYKHTILIHIILGNLSF